MASKTKTCPITRSHFNKHSSGTLMVCVEDPMDEKGRSIPVYAGVKNFKTGSFGWYGNEKATMLIGGEAVVVQIGITITVVGSKAAAD